MEKLFSIRAALSEGCKKVIDNIFFIIGLYALQFLLTALFFLISAAIAYVFTVKFTSISNIPTERILSFGAAVLLTHLFQATLMLGTKRIFMKIYAGEKSSYSEIFSSSLTTIITYIIATFLFYFCSIIGLLILIIPGLIFSTYRIFYDLIIIDGTKGIFESFSLSKKIAYGAGIKLFGFIVISHILNSISGGLLYPIFLFARIDIYKKLRALRGL